MINIILIIMLFLPMHTHACDRCVKIYHYILARQYYISDELYYQEDYLEIQKLEAQEALLLELRHLFESDENFLPDLISESWDACDINCSQADVIAGWNISR